MPNKKPKGKVNKSDQSNVYSNDEVKFLKEDTQKEEKEQL